MNLKLESTNWMPTNPKDRPNEVMTNRFLLLILRIYF